MDTKKHTDLSISQRRIIDLIRRQAKVTRADLGPAIGLTPGAVSRLVRDMLDLGIIKELDRISGMRGQPAVPLRVDGRGGISIGISFPYGRLDIVAMDYAGTQLAHYKTPFEGRDPDELKTILHNQITELFTLEAVKMGRLVGFGLAIPGHLRPDKHKEFVIPPTLDWLDVAALSSWLGSNFDCPVFVENIANSAALSEMYAADDGTLMDLVAINFGHGVGLGLMLSGRIHQGTGGLAGEIGSLFPSLQPRPSAHDLLTAMRSAGRDVPTVNDLGKFAAEGDALIEAWVTRAAQQLYPLVQMLHMIIAPQQIVLTGMLPNSVTTLLATKLSDQMSHEVSSTALNPIRITPGNFDTLANAVGAGWLPIESEGWVGKDRINWASQNNHNK